MMSNSSISKYRQRIRILIDELQKRAFFSVSPDPLIRGTPNEIFKKCGKQNCKCAQDPTNRHGPYKVIQIPIKGKSKQVPLRKNQTESWQKAKNYQKQIKNLAELKLTYSKLGKLVKEIVGKRTEEWP